MNESIKHRFFFGLGCAVIVAGMVAYRIFWLSSGNDFRSTPESDDKDDND